MLFLPKKKKLPLFSTFTERDCIYSKTDLCTPSILAFGSSFLPKVHSCQHLNMLKDRIKQNRKIITVKKQHPPLISHSSVKISLSFLGLFLSYLYSICHLSHCSLVSVPITLLKVKVIHDLLVTKSCSCHFPRIVPGTQQALNKYLF